jgi:hypothetical protein
MTGYSVEEFSELLPYLKEAHDAYLSYVERKLDSFHIPQAEINANLAMEQSPL